MWPNDVQVVSYWKIYENVRLRLNAKPRTNCGCASSFCCASGVLEQGTIESQWHVRYVTKIEPRKLLIQRKWFSKHPVTVFSSVAHFFVVPSVCVCVGNKKSTHSLLCDAWVGLWFGFYKSTEMLAQNEKRLINDNMSHFENNKSKQICKNSHSPRYEPFVVSWFRVTKFSLQVFFVGVVCLFDFIFHLVDSLNDHIVGSIGIEHDFHNFRMTETTASGKWWRNNNKKKNIIITLSGCRRVNRENDEFPLHVWFTS